MELKRKRAGKVGEITVNCIFLNHLGILNLAKSAHNLQIFGISVKFPQKIWIFDSKPQQIHIFPRDYRLLGVRKDLARLC